MAKLPASLQNLIEDFEKLPGIGPKSAMRMAFFILNIPKSQALSFAADIKSVKETLKFCTVCHNISQDALCEICKDDELESGTVMVVERVVDLLAFDRLSSYNGRYHVLGGVISPVNGIGPEELNIGTLLSRLKIMEGEVELIIATSPTLEGEATAIYLKDEFRGFSNVKITRIARGLPSGADLDYADRQTLLRSLQNRTSL